MYWRRKWEPTPCSCLENPRDGGAWLAAVCGVAQSRTQLKRLSSSSSTDPGEPGAKQYLLGLGIIFCMWLSPACRAQDESLVKGIYETAVLKSSRMRDPSCSVGVAIVKLISSMVPPHLPELESQAPFFTPRSLIQSGAQHILLLCLYSLCSAFYIVHTKSLQSRLTLCDPIDSSPPGSFVRGILQATVLKWVAIPFSRGSS